MKIKFCPECGSEDVEPETGAITGSWICRECGFSAPSFPEKGEMSESNFYDEDEEDLKEEKKLMNLNKKVIKKKNVKKTKKRSGANKK